jgi:dTDP-glucose 4,6-dehydratase
MSWKNRRVLVTGAGGFIGSHLVERLLNEGARVRAFLRYTADKNIGNLAHLDKTAQNNIDYFFGDIRDQQAAESALDKVDTVFHLAAIISIPYSIVHPMETFQVNALGTLNFLEAARKKKNAIRSFIATSTSEVYGSAVESPMRESHQKSPQSPYAASKIAADALAQSYYCSYEIPLTVLRPFNTYGPRQSDRAVLPTIISQALYRDIIEIGDVRPKRDFTFVTDTVAAFLMAANRPSAIGQTVHLGTGLTVSIQQALDLVQRIIGTDKKVISDTSRLRPRKSEVTKLISDPSMAKKILGWKAGVTLEEGLRRTIDWVRANPKKFSPTSYRI